MWRKRKSNTDLLTPAGAIMPARKQTEWQPCPPQRSQAGEQQLRSENKFGRSLHNALCRIDTPARKATFSRVGCHGNRKAPSQHRRTARPAPDVKLEYVRRAGIALAAQHHLKNGAFLFFSPAFDPPPTTANELFSRLSFFPTLPLANTHSAKPPTFFASAPLIFDAIR